MKPVLLARVEYFVTLIKGHSLPCFSLLYCILQRQNIWVTWKENLLMKKDVHARKWRGKKPRDELFRERDARFTGEMALVAKEAWRIVCKVWVLDITSSETTKGGQLQTERLGMCHS